MRMSPTKRARIAGLFYVANLATIFVSIYLFRGFSVPGDPVATTANILADIGRYRAAFAFQVMSTAASVAMAALLYDIFKPVDAGVSLMATLFRLLACALAAAGYVLQLAVLVVGGQQFAGVGTAETQAIARVFAALQNDARNVSIAFFACQFLALTYLVARSTFLPRILAVLLALGGVGGLYFAAAPVPSVPIAIMTTVGAGEIALALWLAVKGVHGERWVQQAAASGP